MMVNSTQFNPVSVLEDTRGTNTVGSDTSENEIKLRNTVKLKDWLGTVNKLGEDVVCFPVFLDGKIKISTFIK